MRLAQRKCGYSRRGCSEGRAAYRLWPRNCAAAAKRRNHSSPHRAGRSHSRRRRSIRQLLTDRVQVGTQRSRGSCNQAAGGRKISAFSTVTANSECGSGNNRERFSNTRSPCSKTAGSDWVKRRLGAAGGASGVDWFLHPGPWQGGATGISGAE